MSLETMPLRCPTQRSFSQFRKILQHTDPEQRFEDTAMTRGAVHLGGIAKRP